MIKRAFAQKKIDLEKSILEINATDPPMPWFELGAFSAFYIGLVKGAYDLLIGYAGPFPHMVIMIYCPVVFVGGFFLRWLLIPSREEMKERKRNKVNDKLYLLQTTEKYVETFYHTVSRLDRHD